MDDGISVTSDESKFEYSSDESEKEDLAKNTRLAQLKERRSQFLRLRAMDKVAKTEEGEVSVHQGPKLGGGGFVKNKNVPSQELRRFKDYELTKIDSPVTHDPPSFPSPIDSSEKACWSPQLFETDPFKADTHDNTPDLVNTTNEDSLLNSSNDSAAVILDRKRPYPKWLSYSTQTPKLDSSSNNFLESSYLGQIVISTPWEGKHVTGLQLDDVIIRLNGEDVSSLDSSTVFEMITSGEMGETGVVTYLRKSIEV